MNTVAREVAAREAEPQTVKVKVRLPNGVTGAIIGTFLLLLVGAIYYARGFFLPLALAGLISLTFMPLVRWLGRRGVPLGVSAVALVLAISAVVVAAVAILSDPVTRMVADAPHIATALRDRFAALRQPISAIVSAGDQIRALADGPGSDNSRAVVIAQPGILSWAADTLTGIGTTIGATLLLVIFILSSSDLLLQKIVRAVPTLSDKKRSLRIVYEVQAEVSHYLLTITLINFCLGALIGLAMAAIGMPNPLVWAVAAALLNYIPFIGAITGMVIAAAVGLITFPTLAMAALPPLAYLVLHVTESAFITPMILGRRLELNAVAILIGLAFAGWMWGIVGALIAVPMLVVFKVFCDHFVGLATIGDFLSAESSPDANGDAPGAAASPAAHVPQQG
jgi:predicted PurR-regulated permease PerM